jgi:hypothetical protein
MPKAAQKTSTPKKTETAGDEAPMKAPGCHWEFWNGAIGLSTDLRVFEPATKSARQRNLPDAERIALANYMVDLWTQFRDQHHNVPNQTSVDGDVQARRESLARVISTSKRT